MNNNELLFKKTTSWLTDLITDITKPPAKQAKIAKDPQPGPSKIAGGKHAITDNVENDSKKTKINVLKK